MTQPKRTAPTRGFTLIELLVVIAIIAILAAILFPVFARARENARKTSCLSNTKQLALAFQQYTQDYDEKLTYMYWQPIEGDRAVHWVQRIYPYVKSSQVYLCPSGPDVNPKDMTSEAPYAAGPAYASNWHIGSGPALASIDRVADLVLVGETGVADWLGDGSLIRGATTLNPWHENDAGGGYPNWAAVRCQQQYNVNDPYIADRGQKAFATDWRHLDGANFAYADGHAKWKKRGTLKPENFYPNNDSVPAYANQNGGC